MLFIKHAENKFDSLLQTSIIYGEYSFSLFTKGNAEKPTKQHISDFLTLLEGKKSTVLQSLERSRNFLHEVVEIFYMISAHLFSLKGLVLKRKREVSLEL